MISTVESLIILVFFVAPGFLTTYIINRKVNPVDTSELRLILISLIFSILNHVILSFWTINIYYFYKQNILFTNHILSFISWAIVIIIILPLIIGIIISLLLEIPFMQKIYNFFNISKANRISSAWDYVFLQEEGNWSIVHLKSGDNIFGKIGKKSFISLSHNNHDIFLEEIYNWDEKGNSSVEKFPGTKGAWISADEISWISFWEGGEKNVKK
jgi:hypothetical protein